MKLSIITVNLNNHKGLAKTIESVAIQEFVDFEYIIVDGNSTDESVGLIKQSAERFLSISFKWISEPDSGVFQAMNKGIKMASGEYLLFLNSGDYLIDSKVFSDVFTNDYHADILCAQCNITKNGKFQYVSGHIDVHTFRYYYKYSINHQSTFIKRELFEKFGIYREDFRFCSDWEFFLRTIILNNCSTVNINRVICDYNLDGMSSDERNTSLCRDEVNLVFSNPLLQKFVPDYDLWYKEREEMAPLFWIESKSYLYRPLIAYYKLACLLSAIKYRLFPRNEKK
jgi:glycosyltransferase involved in cell wall biosynthesis